MKKISVKYFSNYKSLTFPCVIYALNLSVFCSKISQKDKNCSRLLKLQKVAPNAKLPSTMGTGLSKTLLQAQRRGILKNIWVGMCSLDPGLLSLYQTRSRLLTRPTISDKIFETLYSNRVISGNKRIHILPLSPPFKVRVFVVF